ncbi:DUF397 domain-containing protein [Lentzea jiangxiensis]|uniref:DUF397 domain-containing protein n=1 Tax=Lentzea jiangxiensis TaxID=641025 RepID=A0A1H0WPP9_9PSEU|nr:DUF397 domain-containing protein [Lentzea jiangxiensis]SDP92628.1 protein of unknown function [Lentzea jiangxiensis]
MAAWHKSTYSANASACVEVATGVGIRDSKAPATHVEVGAAAWTAFLSAVKVVR